MHIEEIQTKIKSYISQRKKEKSDILRHISYHSLFNQGPVLSAAYSLILLSYFKRKIVFNSSVLRIVFD